MNKKIHENTALCTLLETTAHYHFTNFCLVIIDSAVCSSLIKNIVGGVGVHSQLVWFYRRTCFVFTSQHHSLHVLMRSSRRKRRVLYSPLKGIQLSMVVLVMTERLAGPSASRTC